MNSYLQKAINKATELAKQTVEPNGYTNYIGTTHADRTYPFLFNILINLDIQILEKLEVLNKLEEQQKFEKELENISNKISNLSLEQNTERPRPQPELYKFWLPRK